MKRHGEASPPSPAEATDEDALLRRLSDWQRRSSAGDWDWLEGTVEGLTGLDPQTSDVEKGDGVPGAVTTLVSAYLILEVL